MAKERARKQEEEDRGTECANGWIEGEERKRERESATRKGVGKGANNQL